MKLKDLLAEGGYRTHILEGYFNGYDHLPNSKSNGNRRKLYQYKIENMFLGKRPDVTLMKTRRFSETGDYLGTRVVCVSFHLNDRVVI